MKTIAVLKILARMLVAALLASTFFSPSLACQICGERNVLGVRNCVDGSGMQFKDIQGVIGRRIEFENGKTCRIDTLGNLRCSGG